MSPKITVKFFTNFNLGSPCLLLSINEKHVLIDPGAPYFVRANQRMLDAFPLANLSYVVLTHYHGDHASLLADLLNSREFTGQIICHPATRDIVCGYYDLNTYAAERFRVVPFGQRIQLFENTSLTLLNAGHVLGSAMLYFEAEEKRILITGDMGARFLPMVRPADNKLPEAPIDLLLLDGKHADRRREFDLQQHPFGDIIYHKLADCFLYDDGNVLIYAPAIQTPLLIYCLNYIFNNPEYHEFQRKVDYVFLDPQFKVSELLEIFKKHHDLLDTSEREYIPALHEYFYFDKLKFKHSPIHDLRRSILITSNRQQFIEWFGNLRGSARNDVLLLYHNIASVLKEKIHLIDEACDIQIKRLPFLHLHPDYEELKSWCHEVGQRTPIKQTVVYHYDQMRSAYKIEQNFQGSRCGNVKLIHQFENQILEIE